MSSPTTLHARMNPDFAMGKDLLKTTGTGNLFMVFGEPDIELRETADGLPEVEIRGLDAYDPTTGELRSSSVDDIGAWSFDTNSTDPRPLEPRPPERSRPARLLWWSLLARLFERTNIASTDDDNAMRRIVADDEWPAVRTAMVRSGVLREELRPAHGRRSFIRLLVRPADLLAGQVPGYAHDPRIAEFWRLLEQAGHTT